MIAATFVDRLGGALLFPFFALYITERFDVGMTEVGYLFAFFAVANIGGGFLGGGMTDKFGRKSVLLFGLVTSGLSSIAMGLVNDLNVFYLVAIFVGLLASAGGPAQQAMVADLLPEEKQAEGFGISRVVMNLAVVIGPAIGGLLAAQSYLLLFVIDAVTSVITAVIVYLSLPETKPVAEDGQPEQTLAQTMKGYLFVLEDKIFMLFLLVSVLAIIVYMQMNTTLSVYLRDIHDVPAQGYGALLSLNAAMVVLFQFWVTRRIKDRPPMIVLAVGTLFYAIGFGMYGFVNVFSLFILAMYGFSWIIPTAVGPLLAGIVMDNYNPDWVWYAACILALTAVFGLLALHPATQERLQTQTEKIPLEVL